MSKLIAWYLKDKKDNNFVSVEYMNEDGCNYTCSQEEATTLGLDLYNDKHRRDTSICSMQEYNCGGFAFENYIWLVPYDPYYENLKVIEVIRELRIDNSTENIYDEWNGYNFMNKYVIKIMIKRILKNFSDIRLINSLDELQDDEYGILMRTSISDFHFIKYNNKEKKFYHKRGQHCPTEIDPNIVFSETWGFGYDSDIIFFAKKYSN